MILLKLFISFFKTGFFAIGGAYSFLPLIEKEVVEKYSWLTKEEFLEILGIVKVFPGAISIKYATYTGYKIGGVMGIIAANLGNLLAPMILILFAGGLYSKYKGLPAVRGAFSYIQLAAFSMILAVAFQIMPIDQMRNIKGFIVVVVSFCIFLFTKIHPVFIIVAAGLLGILIK